MVAAAQVGVICLPANPQRRHVKTAFGAVFVSAFGHQHRLYRLEIIIMGLHGINQFDDLPGLKRIEIQPSTRAKCRLSLQRPQSRAPLTPVDLFGNA